MVPLRPLLCHAARCVIFRLQASASPAARLIVHAATMPPPCLRLLMLAAAISPYPCRHVAPCHAPFAVLITAAFRHAAVIEIAGASFMPLFALSMVIG